jgi:Brp/Blh family beta-carotene 15,15'-monooxygenase
MALFMAGYLAIVGVAIFCILAQNTLGFEIVVVMSAIHFGIGDAALISEIDSRAVAGRRFAKLPYAIAAGFVPVVIPLVNSESTQALRRVNANLTSWDASFAPIFFAAMLVVAAIAILVMALMRRFNEVLDLSLLVALALIAPPLVAFAFYFGLWHALRHTGRLTLELPSAEVMHSAGRPSAAFRRAFMAGLPALVLTARIDARAMRS